MESGGSPKHLGGTWAQAGQIEQANATFKLAREVTESDQDEGHQVETLSAIAIALAKLGQTEQADVIVNTTRKMIENIQDEQDRDSALSGLAPALGYTKQYVLANQIVERIKEKATRAYAHRMLVRALIQLEQYAQAREVAGILRMNGVRQRLWAL